MKTTMTLIATIALMGCASSGVVQTGPNAYTDEESKSQQNTQYRKDADIVIEKR